MADTSLLLLVPESGDGIQTLKSGIMEIADLFVVNKADRPGADKLRQEIEITLGIRRGNAFRHVPAHHGFKARTKAETDALAAESSAAWKHPVLATIAAKGEGVGEVIEALDAHRAWLDASGTMRERRRRRLEERTREVVDRALVRWVWDETAADQAIRGRLDDLEAGRVSPYELAGSILDALKQGARP
jgi:LAO/AO transport system kinase